MDQKPDPQAASSPRAAHISRRGVAGIPPRQRILGGSLIRGQVTLLIAPPGVGKSTLGLARAIAICTGRAITREEVHAPGNVWVYNNEDSLDELERRAHAILQHHAIAFDAVEDGLFLSSGADYPLLLARANGRGGVLRLPDVDACIEEIRANKISVFIADPMIEMHDVQENSNEQIKRVGQLFREIAWRGDCAVLLVHHSSKPQHGSTEGQAGNMNSARGASALSGIARIVQTIFAMSVKDAQRHGIPEAEKHLYVRLDDAKANLSLVTGKALWFRRVGIILGNGDEVGVLQPVDLAPRRGQTAAEQDVHDALMAALLAVVSERQISLNAAATRLAWHGPADYHRYRETDARGRQQHQRATRPLRNAIAEACKANAITVKDGEAHGFMLVETASPVQLRRFSHPAFPATAVEEADDE